MIASLHASPPARVAVPPHLPPPAPADRLRQETAAVRLSFTWLGVRKTLAPHQKARAAETFGAAGEYLSAGKKLLDTRHPRLRAVGAVRSQAVAYWKEVSLPYPEPGVRLVRRGDVEAIQLRFAGLRAELSEAVAQLDDAYAELRDAARARLGELFDAGDYPAQLAGLFAMEWDFPAVEPPEYLRRLSPGLYRQECERTRARFEEAAALAEQAFCEELQRLAGGLAERLSGDADGRPKVFRDSAVENLRGFFARFKRLRITSSAELDALVADAQQALGGADAGRLRTSTLDRADVAEGLARVAQSLDAMLVDRPRRRILRRSGG